MEGWREGKEEGKAQMEEERNNSPEQRILKAKDDQYISNTQRCRLIYALGKLQTSSMKQQSAEGWVWWNKKRTV